MSFGSAGTTFGTFGSTNNNTGFGSGGAFGSNQNTNNTGTGFGTSTTFGGSTSSPFGGGSTFSGFGSNNTNTGSGLFGNKPAATGFGSSTTGTGLFNNTSNTNTTGFGGTGGAFGTTTTANTSGGGFGGFNSGNNNSSSAFGTQNKTLFGQSGSGTTGTTGFGNTGTSLFGGSGTALGTVGPCPGTNQGAFEPYTDKESNGATSVYQSINIRPPYDKYSFEELRLADYAGGRQWGNGSGTAGTFGTSNFGSAFGTGNTGSPFGGSTNTGGSLFGNTSTSAGGFGTNTATSGTFGNSTGGGLFGNKPATTSLFGNQQTSSTTPGSLFGTSNNTNTGSTFGTGFGNTNNQQQSGGLFGNNQNKTGLFGNTGTSNTGTTGFSFGNNNQQQNTNTTGGMFGNNNNTQASGGGLFSGTNNQQSNTGTGGLFGSQNTQNQTGGLFGNKTGFGTSTTQTQPTSTLFGGGTNTTGGLFSNTSNNQQPGGLFSSTNNNANNQQGNSLFGNQQNKPTGGLFGGTSTNNGGGIFGNNSNNQQGGGLFSSTNNNNNQGGLFASTNNNAGGGLFNSTNNQNKPGLFSGGTTNTQGNSLFNSGMNFGQSQTNQQQQFPNQQEVKHASLLDPNPYGQSSIWTGLPQPTMENSKPLFTPLTATKRLEESARKPIQTLRLNQSRYSTPPRRSGYGLSYSTHGTPSSAASTPGNIPLSGSLYGSRGWSGGSFGRSFNRSASVQNLRSQYASEADDIWKPNAFAPSHRNSNGSIKRLTIDRSLRHDLFNRGPPVPAITAPRQPTNGDEDAAPAQITDGTAEPARKLNKRVSFEKVAEPQLNGETGALQRIEDDDEDASPPRANGTGTGNLQAVPEDRETHQVSTKPGEIDTSDPVLGGYWTKPTRREIDRMPRDQAKAFKGFQVGREGCGSVIFDGTVDLTALPKDFEQDLFEKIVRFRHRTVTVYPEQEQKPSVGKGLNVPSTIAMNNSWPRSQGKPVAAVSGPVYERHVMKLKTKMSGTEFVDYDAQTGRWTFKVPHYTRYGLDYDEDETSMMDQSELSLPPHSFDKSADASVMEIDDQTESNDEDDTFAFKKSVPGQFEDQSIIPADDDDDADDQEAGDQMEEQYDDGSERSAVSEDDMMSEDERSPMPGSMPQAPNPYLISPAKSPTKFTIPGTPGKPLLDLEGDWAEQLQRTISPRKQNRELLREAQSKILLDKAFSPIKPKAALEVNFRSSIDVMNHLFKSVSGKKSNKANEPDFEFPYSKRSKLFHPDDEEMSEQDRAWHNSFKPHFTTDGRIVYRTSKLAKDQTWEEKPIAGARGSLVVMARPHSKKAHDLDSALSSSHVTLNNGVPTVQHKAAPFSQLATQAQDKEVVDVYNLAHVLFDDYEDEFTLGLSGPLQKTFAHRIRKDRLTRYLSEKILATVGADEHNVLKAAILRLTGHDIRGACELLKDSKNIRLLLLVAQLDGADAMFMDDAKAQIDAWRDHKSLSEFDCDVRTLYELCSGNVAVSRGKEGKTVPVEDQAETFSISTRYGLSWLQCFALGLFYGKAEKNNAEGFSRIEDAVREYQSRCDREEEPTKPHENDVHWSLLKLFASSHDEAISAPRFPAALKGLSQSWNHTATFNFSQACQAALDVSIDAAKADELAETLAAELGAQDDLASAIYILSHISKPETRQTLIQALLDRFAASLPGSDTATSDSGIALWQRLTIDLKVPTSWIYMSKARYAASATNKGGDNISELRYLVAAEAWKEAHECLLKRVAPSLIIDEDYTFLLEMCRLFGDDPIRRVSSWYNGGEVFATFSQLMIHMIAKTDTSAIASLRKKLVTMGHKQAHGRKVKLGQLSQHELEEHAAVREMANALARLSQQGGSVGETKEILELPLTEDVRLEIMMDAGIAPQQSAKKSRGSARNRGLGIDQGTSEDNDDAMDEDTDSIPNGTGA